MATTLPVPIEFSLPEGWQAVHPDAAGAPGVAFVAVQPNPGDGFTTNIAIKGEYRDDDTDLAADLTALADESVSAMEERGVVRVADRTEVDSQSAPALTQRLELATVVKGEALDLVQCQVYLAMTDTTEPHKRVVLELAMTSTSDEFGGFLGDFQEFLRTVRPAESPADSPKPGTRGES